VSYLQNCFLRASDAGPESFAVCRLQPNPIAGPAFSFSGRGKTKTNLTMYYFDPHSLTLDNIEGGLEHIAHESLPSPDPLFRRLADEAQVVCWRLIQRENLVRDNLSVLSGESLAKRNVLPRDD